MKYKIGFLSLIVILLLNSCSYFKKTVGIEDPNKEPPLGEYIGTAKKVKQEGEAIPVKINLLPKAKGLVDGVGVLLIDDNSQRFYWRSTGDNSQTWNLLFVKDNNLYSSLKDTFKFDGIVKATEINNKIEGRLSLNYDATPVEYYLEAFQVFKPKLIPGKNALEVKAGENFTVDVERLGDTEADVVVTIRHLAKKTETLLEVVRADKPDASFVTKLYLQIPKGTEKGDYIMYLTRQAEYKSNNLPFKVI